jgi:hypothetical protein
VHLPCRTAGKVGYTPRATAIDNGLVRLRVGRSYVRKGLEKQAEKGSSSSNDIKDFYSGTVTSK